MSKDTIYKQDAIDAVADGLKRVFVENRDVAEILLKNVPSAKPQDIARDIATIIENEKDMRVIAKNAQPEQKNCEYCHTDRDGYVKPLEKNCHAYIRFGMDGWTIELKAKGWNGKAPIRFCPMCGRDLLVK